jgi:hypothetical protein
MWNRFDICAAYYVFAMHFHGGQNSAAYSTFSTFSRLRYEPRSFVDSAAQHGEASDSMMAHGDDFDNARYILACLIRRHRATGWEPRHR